MVETSRIRLGKCENQESFGINFTETQSIILAGTSGSGKSNLLHRIITELIKESVWEFILIDPKCVEFKYFYKDHSNLKKPVIEHSIDDALISLTELIAEIHQRKLIHKDEAKYIGPNILIVIDEFSDLMTQQPQEIENAIVKIAQEDPELGVRLIIATSRPSDDVFTKSILEAIPDRIAGKLNTSEDSMRVLGCIGAEMLNGEGDFLYIEKDLQRPVRFHADFIAEEDIKAIASQKSEVICTLQSYESKSFIQKLVHHIKQFLP
jgi:DNA segregation ATPase FtsK/SpoIIIE-like protein